MIIDIGAHLRRLVLAGLPLLGTACDVSALTPAPPAPLTAACQPRMVVEGPLPGGAQTLAIGFDWDDVRVADLYEACLGPGDYCLRLCHEVLGAAGVRVPAGQGLSPPHRCELACDRAGQPVATISYTTFSQGVPGRRPEGFAEGVRSEPGTSLGDFFAACAALEGASIAAFTQLAAELEHHGAPAGLTFRARVAAREEARHFKLTARLARSFGAGRVRCPRIPPRPPRELAALALENVIEGCVNETFSAAVALWQAANAADLHVRTTLAGIAEDELSHAQLAWDVHEWASERLGPRAAQQLEDARADAARTCRRAAATRSSPSWSPARGSPTPRPPPGWPPTPAPCGPDPALRLRPPGEPVADQNGAFSTRPGPRSQVGLSRRARSVEGPPSTEGSASLGSASFTNRGMLMAAAMAETPSDSDCARSNCLPSSCSSFTYLFSSRPYRRSGVIRPARRPAPPPAVAVVAAVGVELAVHGVDVRGRT